MTQPSPRKDKTAKLLARLDTLTPQELKRYLAQELTRKKLGLVWESDLIERDQALNSNLVFPALNEDASELNEQGASGNLIIEGDNFDALRLLKTTHAGKIRVIYIDPPYNTGNNDWVYNDHYVKSDDRWKHSLWLEFMYQRMVLARDLLAQDGVLLISINDENRSRLELLMDEVMPGRRVGSFVWRVRSGGNDTKGALLSNNHEHVLVYANPSFAFNGDQRNEGAYSNPDKDKRGPWTSGDLVKPHTAKQRPEAFYSIHNPVTDIWYPCDFDSVWRFGSLTRPSKKALRTDPIEKLIKDQRILWPKNEDVACYASLNELKKAISNGTAPKQLKVYNQLSSLKRAAPKDDKITRLLTYIEPLENWVGRNIGYGKPRLKRFLNDLNRDVTPISSWLHPTAFGEPDYEDEIYNFEVAVGATGEGTAQFKKIMGSKDFPYPKPLSLIKTLVDQATRPNDIVLDFFAGSGTTGHAVLALNAQDGGNRKFILCSSTEATSKDPDKNLCRDVCAERIRRVINGYGKTPGLGGDFSYLNLDLIEEADLMFEAKAEHAYALLCLRETGVMRTIPKDGSIWPVDHYEGAATVVCPSLDDQTISELQSLKVQRLVVYIDRPESLIDMWEKTGHAPGNLQAYGLETALRWGQLSREHIAGADEISHFIDDAMEPAQREQA